jgi:excisionase family DNA binding protein
MNRSLAMSGQVLQRTDDVIVAIEPRLIGLEVAALVYDLSADTIAELQDAGEMPVVRIGKRRLVPVQAVDAWIAGLVDVQAA